MILTGSQWLTLEVTIILVEKTIYLGETKNLGETFGSIKLCFAHDENR